MPRGIPFQPGNQLAKLGGLAKRGCGFRQQAQAWVRSKGFDKAIAWVDSKSDRKATFAMGILFSYALGKPAEQIQIEDKREFLVRLVSDPALNELAKRFGDNAGRIQQSGGSGLADGSIEVQAESTADGGI